MGCYCRITSGRYRQKSTISDAFSITYIHKATTLRRSIQGVELPLTIQKIDKFENNKPGVAVYVLSNKNKSI